jgi:sn-glycerol 3-phosphate transport system substrate-binding protein
MADTKNRRRSLGQRTLATGLATALTLGAVVTTGRPAAAAQPTQVTYWYGIGGALGKVVQTMVGQFNASHPSVHVTAQFQGSYSGGGPEQQKLLAAIASGAVPDMAQMEVNSIGQFAASGALLPLDSFLKKSSVDAPSGFLPGLLLSGQYKGVQYGLPFNRSVPILYYNAAMLKAAGIASAPTTWTTLAADARKLAHGSGSSKVYGFNPLVDWWPWESYTLSAGGAFFSKDGTQAAFDSKTALAPLAIQQDLVKAGVAKINTGATYWSQNIEDFAQGKTAMTLGSPADMATINQDAVSSVAKVWRTALLPTTAGHKLIVPPGGGNAVIFKNISQSHIQAAETFVQWFTSPSEQVYWSEHTGYMPVTKAAVDTRAYQAYLNAHPNSKVVIQELSYLGAMPLNTHYLTMLQFVQQGLQAVFDKQQDPANAMQQVATRVNGILQS